MLMMRSELSSQASQRGQLMAWLSEGSHAHDAWAAKLSQLMLMMRSELGGQASQRGR